MEGWAFSFLKNFSPLAFEVEQVVVRPKMEHFNIAFRNVYVFYFKLY